MRVAIIDDDLWIRTGRRTALSQFPDIEVVAAVEPDTAMSLDWNEVDVAVVDAHDPSQPWDRYPGVRVVEAIRKTRKSSETTIIVISGRLLEPMLRLRMAEAGADYFYAHIDVPTPESLARIIQHPSPSSLASPPDDRLLAEIGLRSWSRPNEALRWLEVSGNERFFRGTGTQKTAGGSRRVLDRVRDQVSRVAHLDPALGDPEKRPGDVSWRDVVKFVHRAIGRDGGF